jgi:hypothetical protein
MAYCTTNDVDRLLKWFEFSASSKITTTELTTYFIPEVDAIIDAKLANTYEVPITDSDDLEVIKYAACRMVACEVAHVLILQSRGNVEIPNIVNRWCETAKGILEDIISQKIPLPGSTLKTTDRLWSFTAHGDSENDAPEREWKRGTVQW